LLDIGDKELSKEKWLPEAAIFLTSIAGTP